MREILELWRKPANADTEENRELQDTIKNSVIKHKLVLYHTVKTITQEEVPIEAEEVFEEKKKKTKKQAAKRGKKATETLPPKPTTKTITHVDLSRSVMAQEVPDDAYSADNVNNRDPSNKKDMAWFGGCHQDATTILYTPPPRGWRWKNPDGTVSGELV